MPDPLPPIGSEVASSAGLPPIGGEVSAIAAPASASTSDLPSLKQWLNRGADWLPTVGGIAGGIAGGMGGLGVGAIPAAAAGGLIGERAREYIHAATGQEPLPSQGQALKQMATQGAIQGGSEVIGQGLGKVAERVAPALMQGALKPGIRDTVLAVKSGNVPPVVQTLLDEGINVSQHGVQKLNTLIDATGDEIRDAIAQVPASINPFKVTSKLGETARTFAQQVNPNADLDAISRAGQEFLANNPTLTVQQAQALKQGTYRQLSSKAYTGELKSADVEAQKSLARGLKDEIANEVNASLPGFKGALGLPGGVDISALNAREGALLGAQDALARRVAVGGNANPMGLAALAVSHPLTFLTVMSDRSPAFKSMLARGLYNAAGSISRVSPQVIKGAVAAVATSGDSTGPSQSGTGQ